MFFSKCHSFRSKFAVQKSFEFFLNNEHFYQIAWIDGYLPILTGGECRLLLRTLQGWFNLLVYGWNCFWLLLRWKLMIFTVFTCNSLPTKKYMNNFKVKILKWTSGRCWANDPCSSTYILAATEQIFIRNWISSVGENSLPLVNTVSCDV